MTHNQQQRRWRLFGGIATAAIFVAACTPLSLGTEKETLATDSTIIVSSDDQTVVSVSEIDHQIVLDIHSDSGIGSVDVSGLTGPETILLQLHMSGLEQFRFLYGSTEVEVSVSSRGNLVVMQSVIQQGGEAEAIDEESPYWLRIELVAGNGDPLAPIPMQDGYFQVTPPIDFAHARPASFRFSWIDFYR